MHLLLRCDAGPTMGVGHVIRCLALAEEAHARGWTVSLSGSVDDIPWVRDLVASMGIDRVAPVVDAAGLAHAARQVAANLVVVDSYTMPNDLRGPLNAIGATLISVEDNGYGRRAADLAVDTGIGADVTSRPDDGSGVVLAGPRYALLRRQIIEARERRSSAIPPADQRSRVLVVMGGTDPSGAGLGAARCVVESGVTNDVLLVTAVAPDPTVVDGTVRVMPPRPDLPGVMADCMAVVSAAGISTLELCCIGVPALLLWTADNQRSVYRAAIAAGAAFGLGPVERLRKDPAAVAADLRTFLGHGQRLQAAAERAAMLVDGHGAGRVLDTAAQCAGAPPGQAHDEGDPR